MSIVTHWQTRVAMIAAHRRTAGANANMIIGDSITEQFWWNSIGQYRIVNGGLGGINVVSMLTYIDGILAGASPKYVIMMLGTNDAFPQVGHTSLTQAQLDAWETNYKSLISTVQARGAKVILASVNPIELGKALSASRSQTCVNQLNNTLVNEIQGPLGLRLINTVAMFRGSTGTAKPGSTVDGLHPSQPSYVTLYNNYLTALTAAGPV